MYRAIPGYPKYAVNERGTVVSHARGKRRRLRIYRDGRGYPVVTLYRDGKGTMVNVHRIVLAAFVGPCPDGLEVRHLDGNRENNRLDNLAYGTHAENYADRIRHGTDNSGERNGKAKLTDADVRAARDMRLRDGMSLAEIGRILGVDARTISRAVNGECWAHLAA